MTNVVFIDESILQPIRLQRKDFLSKVGVARNFLKIRISIISVNSVHIKIIKIFLVLPKLDGNTRHGVDRLHNADKNKDWHPTSNGQYTTVQSRSIKATTLSSHWQYSSK